MNKNRFNNKLSLLILGLRTFIYLCRDISQNNKIMLALYLTIKILMIFKEKKEMEQLKILLEIKFKIPNFFRI
jgi:hypothetical protein